LDGLFISDIALVGIADLEHYEELQWLDIRLLELVQICQQVPNITIVVDRLLLQLLIFEFYYLEETEEFLVNAFNVDTYLPQGKLLYIGEGLCRLYTDNYGFAKPEENGHADLLLAHESLHLILRGQVFDTVLEVRVSKAEHPRKQVLQVLGLLFVMVTRHLRVEYVEDRHQVRRLGLEDVQEDGHHLEDTNGSHLALSVLLFNELREHLVLKRRTGVLQQLDDLLH